MTQIGTVIGLSKYDLEVGTPQIKSVGPLAFGPEGILFIGDNIGAAIFAIDVRDHDAPSGEVSMNMDMVDTSLAALLGCSREDVHIKDMTVHPISQNTYLSVMRGSGDSALPVLIKIGPDGMLSHVLLEDVPFSQSLIEDAPDQEDPRTVSRDQLRTVTVTDMAYVDGVLLVAGASNEEFSSTLRRIPFPFTGSTLANSLEIFHVSHGKYETAAPIRNFVPYDGNASVLASYTCTPVVQFSLTGLNTGTQVKGKTVAELGARNRPFDMVSYVHANQEYLLVSNSTYALMKIACKDIDEQECLTQPEEPVGVPRQELPHQGVSRMENLNGSNVLMMQRDADGNISLRSYGVSTL